MDMREENAGCRQFLCALSFLLGSSAGAAIGFLCSEKALIRMQTAVLQWYIATGPVSCFSAELTVCLLLLFFALSAIGRVCIPAVNCLYGAALSLYLFSFINCSAEFAFFFSALSAVFSSLPIIRLSILSEELSFQVFRLWRSSGARCFDLRRVTFRISLSLLTLFIIFLLRCIIMLIAH